MGAWGWMAVAVALALSAGAGAWLLLRGRRPASAPAEIEGAAPEQATLVEDTLVNLRAARQVGLRTVHVYHPATPFGGHSRARAGYVDLRVNSIPTCCCVAVRCAVNGSRTG